MKYGLCCKPEIARKIRDFGFDYFEWNVGNMLAPREGEDVFAAALAEAQDTGLPCPCLCVLLPKELKVVGPEVDLKALEDYCRIVFSRGQKAGIEHITFGSGGARNIPDGFNPAEAMRQVRQFLQLLSGLAADNGIIVSLEHLNHLETNMLNSIDDCAALVREINRPSIRLLSDGYHLLMEDGNFSALHPHVDLVAHAHIATAPNRLAPGMEESDLYPFFSALIGGGYDGRLSIEGKTGEIEQTLPRALELMKQLEQRARESSLR